MANNENSKTEKMVCPICGNEFDNVHDFAKHMNDHSVNEKVQEEKEKKKRFEDQKRYDKSKVVMLYDAYQDALAKFIEAENEFCDKYNEHIMFKSAFPQHDIINDFFNLFG